MSEHMICAVTDCKDDGHAHICPYDGRFHHHGRIHYGCGYPESSLKFREGWNFVCDRHYEILKTERECWASKEQADE
jgi:hypothetical protein